MSKKLDGVHALWEEKFAKLYAPSPKILVRGEGSQSARIALVGEAPGKQETLQQRPFVGKAGKNLDEFLQLSGLLREELYITNVVKFRPVRVSERNTTANRTPNAEEIALFKPWLLQELSVLAPRLVVTLGNTALHALTGTRENIGTAHGVLHECALDAKLFPLYHPAAVIYNHELRSLYEADLQKLKEYCMSMA